MSEIIGIDIAVIVVTISILLSGILIGLGKAVSLKKMELFGIEELTQSIINGALVGGIFAIIEMVQTLSAEIIEPACSSESLISGMQCVFSSVSNSLFVFSQELTKLSLMIGYYQTMALDFSAFEIQPFANLSGVTNILSTHLLVSNLLIILTELNIQILSFFAENAIFLFLPLGLIFRSFFATRKIGGFLIAFSIGIYLFYPAFMAVFPSPVEEIQLVSEEIKTIYENENYAVVPILDLNSNNAIAGKLDNMSNGNFASDIGLVEQKSSNIIAKTILYSIIAPLFSLMVTIIFIRELGRVLGGEMSFSLGVI